MARLTSTFRPRTHARTHAHARSGGARITPQRHACARACALLLAGLSAAAGALAQERVAAVQQVTITGSNSQQPVTLAGFGDLPLSLLPLSVTVITRGQLADAGIFSLGDLTRLDADITDAYNAPGYVNQLAVRGFTLDNRFNYRRDGLPINAETVIPSANKQAVELLKGTSGLQAGTSAPGGLLNLVVKRPVARIRDAGLNWMQDGTVEATLDIGDRAGVDGVFGWRVNAAGARLDPQTFAARGSRHMAAAAVDFRAGATLVEAEIELSRQSQPSTPGFSLLGDQLPDAATIDPRINLNNQSWSLPVVFEGRTGSVRVTHTLAPQTDIVAHVMRQDLRTDDRVAFPYGCSTENRYDRYCADGTFDLYDFRSEGERRVTDASSLGLRTQAQFAGMTHRLDAGLLWSRHDATFGRQAYNWVGIGTIDGLSVVPPDPTLTDENTHRHERSTEFHVQDAVTLTPATMLWLGARHTQLRRESVRTDGSRPTAYDQSFTTPWLALSHQLQGTPGGRGTSVYASWGKGIESEVTPNRSRYVNRGEALPALESRQVEIGIKHRTGAWDSRAALFDIRRPAWNDFHVASGLMALDDCSDTDACVRRADGIARHRGIEAETEWRQGALSVRASAMWLQARREDATDAAANGLRPTNVPARSLKLQGAWNLAQVPGLTLLAFVNHEGARMVTPDNRIATPGWTRLDLGARWRGQLAGQDWQLRLAVDNATDRRAWQEAPFQYGHAYLYPLAPRTWRVAAETRF